MDLLDGKKRENIASYVISMWHIEDLMRACRFDPDALERTLVAPMEADEETKEEVRSWYGSIMQRMLEQGLEQQGHLSEVSEVIGELEFLHTSLVTAILDEDYTLLYEKAAGDIDTLRQQAGEDARGPVETALTAVYGVMVLRARGDAVSEATEEAEGHIRRMLEDLAQHYRHMHKLPGVSMN